jgi:hypothetical protein
LIIYKFITAFTEQFSEGAQFLFNYNSYIVKFISTHWLETGKIDFQFNVIFIIAIKMYFNAK